MKGQEFGRGGFDMEDIRIVQLYWDRNQNAITQTAVKYGKYCTSIAINILGSQEDAEECVNDTYLNAWNCMPPHRPSVLSAFLGKITRNLSYNRYKYNMANKRGGSEISAVLDSFLDTLSPKKRSIFVCRYWYTDSISEIARQFQMRENAVSMTLIRIRSKLREYLRERGYEL